METGYKRSQGAVVLALLVTYVLFVFSYVWYLPNYNFLRTGGNRILNAHTILKTGTRHSGNYTQPEDKGVWLEKVSKTTPETKRGIELVLIGTAGILSSLFTVACVFPWLLTPVYKQRQGYAIFAHQHAYLSLRTFRI